MSQVVTLVAAGSLLSGAIGAVLAAVALQNHEEPGALPFALLSLAIGVWALADAGSYLVAAPTAVYWLDRVGGAASAQTAPLALVFVLAYAGYERWLIRRWLALVWVVPGAYALLLFTAPLHGVTGTVADVYPITAGGITIRTVPTGIAYTLFLVWTYAVLLLAFFVLSHFYLRARNVYRNQTAAILVGSAILLVTNGAFQLGVSLHPAIDLTPVTFVLTGVIIGWALFRYDFLSVAPIASDELIEQLPDPVLVLDDRDRVVDANPAALERFGSDIERDPLSAVAPDLEEHVVEAGTDASTDGERVDTPTADGERVDASADDVEATYTHAAGQTRVYDPNVRTIEDQHGTVRGRLVVLRDVTGQRRRQDRLEALQSATRQFIAAATPEEIAELAVAFADDALDRHAAGVFLVEDDEPVFRPAAVTDAIEEYYDASELVIDDPESSFHETLRTGERRAVEVEGKGRRFDRLLLVALGEHGVLAIGTHEEGFAAEDEQFVTILARATQVALTQVEREQELRESRAAIERRNEQIGFFNGVLRHTLRNALLVIQGRAEILREEVDAGQDHLDRIDRWAQDLADLTETIRAINDTVAATESERLAAVDVRAMIRERTRAVRSESGDVTVARDLEEDLSVRANDLAGEVIESVVRNAVRHNDTASPTVEVTAREVADRVQVRVADDGPGIDDDLKTTLFERDVGTTHTGGGFGLYFVSMMMDLYGGTVWVEDNEPRGAVVVLEFQAASPSDDEAKNPSHAT